MQAARKLSFTWVVKLTVVHCRKTVESSADAISSQSLAEGTRLLSTRLRQVRIYCFMARSHAEMYNLLQLRVRDKAPSARQTLRPGKIRHKAEVPLQLSLQVTAILQTLLFEVLLHALSCGLDNSLILNRRRYIHFFVKIALHTILNQFS